MQRIIPGWTRMSMRGEFYQMDRSLLANWCCFHPRADGIRIRPRHDAVITDLRRGGSAGAKEHALRRRDAARIADDQAAHVSDAAYAVDRAKRIACFAGQRYRWRGASL